MDEELSHSPQDINNKRRETLGNPKDKSSNLSQFFVQGVEIIESTLDGPALRRLIALCRRPWWHHRWWWFLLTILSAPWGAICSVQADKQHKLRHLALLLHFHLGHREHASQTKCHTQIMNMPIKPNATHRSWTCQSNQMPHTDHEHARQTKCHTQIMNIPVKPNATHRSWTYQTKCHTQTMNMTVKLNATHRPWTHKKNQMLRTDHEHTSQTECHTQTMNMPVKLNTTHRPWTHLSNQTPHTDKGHTRQTKHHTQ